MITIYGAPNTRSTKVLWLLEELQLEYEYIFVDLQGGETHAPAFLKLNPNGKLPVLVEDDLILLEAQAICRYIVDKKSESGVLPKAGLQVYRYEQWCSFNLSELEAPAFMLTKNKLVYPDTLQINNLEPAMHWEIKRAFRILSLGLADQPYIIGQQFTLADIHIGFTLLWIQSMGIVAKEDNINAYMNRLFDRAAFKTLFTKGYLVPS